MDTTNIINNPSVDDFQNRRQLVKILKNRFNSYGYQQIRTSTFESYDLYSSVSGTIPQNEMIKTIDPTGGVLVLRPDVTIPITQEIAAKQHRLSNNMRYFYVLDVFHQSFSEKSSKERTQAGVECFGDSSKETDAEVIALAANTLTDLGELNFKIEVGHAGFFKELVEEMALADKDLEQLKRYIQAKNMTEIGPFLINLGVEARLVEAMLMIPMLYGQPEDVIERAKTIALNDRMVAELQGLIDVYQLLQAYEVEANIVFDLGLINHMDYYSGIIFQGFINNVSRPVLMGGRYDHLADQFDASIPAIGFAFEIDALLEGISKKESIPAIVDFQINYEINSQHASIMLANKLRQRNHSVITALNTTKQPAPSRYTITVNNQMFLLIDGGQEIMFTDFAELELLFKNRKEGI